MKSLAFTALAAAACALPAAAQAEDFEERILPFRPSVHGMPFTNAGGWNVKGEFRIRFLHFDLTFPWEKNWGFCGGLCYLAQDDYYAGAWRARGGPKPPPNSQLHSQLHRRQLDSLGRGSWLKVWKWQQRKLSDGNLGLHSMRQAVPDEWHKVRIAIDRGELAQICEIYEHGPFANPGKNHQVLAYGYRHYPNTGRVVLHTYDPNGPDRDDIWCRDMLANLDRFEYQGEPQFRAWLFNKALHKLGDRRRYYHAQKRDAGRDVATNNDDSIGDDYGSYYANFCTPSLLAVGKEEAQRVEAAFDELPENYREVITLARVVGLSHKEIGERLGKSEEACRVLLRRALVMLAFVLRRGEQ